MTDLDAEHYRNHSFAQYSLVHEILSEIRFEGTETILDVGCGDGRITAELSKCVPKGNIIGIDSSCSMIDLASQTFQKKEYPNLDFKGGAVEKLTYRSSIDVALIMNTLHWIRDSQTALSKIAAALKPGGNLFVLTYPKESIYWQFLEETVNEEEWAAYKGLSAFKTIHTSQEYINMLSKVGLMIDLFSLNEEMAIYSTGDALSNYIKGWLNCYLPLSKEHENEFLKKAVNKAYLHSLSGNNGEIRLPYSKLTIKARK